MGIQPPSDLILDVINAADPMKAQAMATRLKQAAASPTPLGYTAGFDDEMKQAALPLEQMSLLSASSSVSLRNATALSQKNGTNSSSEAYRRFEAMVLSSFVESMLPTKASTVYGSGTAGDVWRSMLAERIANEVAKTGGIGIADRLATNAAKTGADKPAPTSGERPL
ncbi:rod-binding protein [Aquabacter sp. CN5-332]|uniref:rod-binding protein n=1 Tax=Aquabacter sp. CN5-332 TaxID=3156608 RepID=UPI0032B42E32